MALDALTEEVVAVFQLSTKEPKMNKLLSILIAGVFATVATTGFAQDKKAADAPKAEMKKDEMKKDEMKKADKPMKKEKKAKAKKAKAEAKK